jgi:hypothetical protein
VQIVDLGWFLMATNPNPANVIQNVRTIVAAHYERSSSPMLLAALGERLRKQGQWSIEDQQRKKLRELIEEANDPDLVIVRDKASPAYIAVATATAKPMVEEFIAHRTHAPRSVPDVGMLPRPVLLAFCVRHEPGRQVFLRKLPPYRYSIGIPEDDDANQYWMIDERYRRPGLKIGDLKDLSTSDLVDLQTRIASWAIDTGFQIETLYQTDEKKPTSALQRLLEAQLPGIADRILIPADIALILSKQ